MASKDPYEGASWFEKTYLEARTEAKVSVERLKKRWLEADPEIENADLDFADPASERAIRLEFLIWKALAFFDSEKSKRVVLCALAEHEKQKKIQPLKVYWKSCEKTRIFIINQLLHLGAKHLLHRMFPQNAQSKKDLSTLKVETLLGEVDDIRESHLCPQPLKKAFDFDKNVFITHSKTIWSVFVTGQKKQINRYLKSQYTKDTEELIKLQRDNGIMSTSLDIEKILTNTSEQIYTKVLFSLIKRYKKAAVIGWKLRIDDPVGHALINVADDLIRVHKKPSIKTVKNILEALKTDLTKKLQNQNK